MLKITHRLPRLTFLLLPLWLAFIGLALPGVRADDGIFPPAPAAAPFIDFDNRGFLIHGQRTFLVSGGMEYARIPHQLWRDRLLRLKRAGFNTVEIYTFWNFHEPTKGTFDFSGDKDLNAFLKLVKAMDLYAVVRVGPYVCAEWDSGGYPVWLRFEPGVRVREDNPQFEKYMDRWLDHLMPIVSANQINHGGAVVMVQLENEHPQGWGREMPNAYFKHLRDKALSLGLEVPWFFSGLHHSSDPAGNDPWSSAGRSNPWYSTEFWSVWYDHYGASPDDLVYDRRFWKVLAYGGNGLNFYMLHGGSNFATWNNDEDAASYDYGAAIGETGDLRPIYYRFKRAALFARTFQTILEDSDNATDRYKAAATEPGIRVTARQSPAGTILFLDNTGKNPVQTQVKEADGTLFPSGNPLTVAPGQIVPVVRDYALLPGVTLERATPLLGIVTQGRTTTLVAYGPPGAASELRFRVTGPLSLPATHIGTITRSGDHLTVQDPISESIGINEFRAGEQTICILTMSTALSDSTWFVDNNIIVEPGFVGEDRTVNGKLSLSVEYPTAAATAAFLYGAGSVQALMPDFVPLLLPPVPTLTPWQTHSGDAEAQPGFADGGWKSSTDPLPMGADGDYGAYAWYRAVLRTPKAGIYALRFTDGGDRASVYVGGKPVGSASVKKGVSLALPAGPSSLAVLTAHYGRPKLFGYLGPIDTVDAKGLRGPVILDAGTGTGTAITNWRIKQDDTPALSHPPTVTTGAGWTDGTTGPDIFQGRRGYAWYRTTLPDTPGPLRRLHFENVDDNATVYLNGTQIAAHQGWGAAFDAPLDAQWHPGGPNELAVLVQNTDGGGGIQGAVTLQTVTAGSEIAVQNWKMRGGVGELPTLWKPLPETVPNAANSIAGSPTWYRTTFTTTPPGATGPHPILRVATTGLSRGFVWLNGHNLGRYPEKIPVSGLYLPEPWLLPGVNQLIFFDEEGASPASVTLGVESASSRFMVPLREK